MPPSKKPNLIPDDPAPPGPERAAFTMSFDTEVELDDASEEPRRTQTRPEENSKVSRRPLAGTRPVAPSRGTPPNRGTEAPRERTRGPAGGMAAEGKQVRLLPGRRVPGTRYRLVRWLGEGGMGVVYEAEHEDIERRVALKILRIEASEDPQQAAQFREEARAASRIGSPNIVEIFDFGELPDGRLMFAMELLNGQGLDAELDRCPMEQGRMIGILRQVCKGLAAAHEVGIIHRDVKPDNILLLAGGTGANQTRADRVKVVDFGIATMHSETDTGAAGTPHYMAPEQVLGVAFDGRLDMYSLGCTAYELLVGKPPFVAQSVDEILQAQIEAKPVPPSQLCPAGSVHPAVEAVILRCLEKTPANRYRDMHDLEAALCEAQIAAGLRSVWDDLALPPVDVERRDELMRNMPAVDGLARPRRRWMWPAIAAGSSLFAAGLTALLLFRGPTVEASAEVDTITNAARAAGARANWVYPPSDDPNATSYRKVINLEQMEGAAEKLAQERARELRHEFAESLVGLGDDYWEKDGGKPFARDYYLQALNFEPDNTQARERAGATPGMIAEFRDKAAQGTFSEAEIRAAAPLIALAEKDEDKREEKLLALADNSDDAAPASSSRSLDRLIRATSSKPSAPRVRKKSPEDEVKVAVGPSVGSEPPGPAIDPFVDPGRPAVAAVKRDTKQSNKLVKDARAALAAGNRKEAESLFHQALGYDNRNASALIGLSDLEFDRGAHQRAADFAEKAIAAAPKNGAYHLRLGDAFFKILKYTEARSAYQKARELGVREADGRLEKLKAKLGK
ncbi:MAG: protein kinase [Nannocystis sp.]|nr:serine/threonine-protein kinase [Nannocystis sp.]MBA3549790.1 protein kinase [Nannocystis sp.]